jgi:hypothetical protein
VIAVILVVTTLAVHSLLKRLGAGRA